MKVKLAVALAILFLAGVAHADGAPAGTLYDINGSMTLTGDSNCPSCTETINYSFVLDESPGCPSSITVCLASPVITTSSGPLGVFVAETSIGEDHGPYLGFDAPGLDQIDMYFTFRGLPTALPSNLWACNSAACQADFSIGDQYEFAVANEFTAVDPAPTAPEPSSFLLLGIGLAALIGVARVNPRRAETGF